MSDRPWYKRYGADFVFGTLGLSLEEKGAYSLCLDLMYDRGGPIPDDARWLAGICNVSVRKWNAIRDRLVDVGKLSCEDGKLTNNRAEREIAIARKSAREAVENGRKGGQKQAENRVDKKENKDLDQATLDHRAHKPDTRERLEEPNGSLPETSSGVTSISKATRQAYPADFAEFWKGYPTSANMPKKEAFSAWKRLSPAQKVEALASLPGFRAFCSSKADYQPVYADRYLRQERWEGHLQTANKAREKFFVREGSPEAGAWREFRGKPLPVMEHNGERGWFCDTQWPVPTRVAAHAK